MIVHMGRSPHLALDSPPNKPSDLAVSGTLPASGLLALFAAQVNFGGQAAAGPAQPMIGRLIAHTAGRLGLQIPLLRAPAAC
jgi:hypothetical protein